jgi:hypothetical protein
VDNVGNVEPLAATPDATITLVAPAFVPVGRKLSFTDADGDRVTLKYKGPGTAQVALVGGAGDNAAIDFLQIDGSTTKSKLKIGVKQTGSGDGAVEIGDVTINGSFGAFSAKKSDLVFNGLTASGIVKSIAVRDLVAADPLLGQTQIATGGGSGGGGAGVLKVSARVLGDGFVLETPSAISKLAAETIGAGVVTATAIGKLLVKGNVTDALILAGARLGADHALGGTGANADTFSAGSINSVKIGGAVNGGTIGAGLDPVDGVLRNGNDAILGGVASRIAKLIVKGSASGDSYFAAGAFVKTPKIGGVAVNPASDPRFLVG